MRDASIIRARSGPSLTPMVSLVPSEYARSNRVWQGTLPLSSFARLHEALGNLEADIEVRLEFSIDENARIRVIGEAIAPANLMCYTCMKMMRCHVPATINARIVKTDREAEQIFADYDAIVLGDGPTEVQELIEDDILMSIPNRVCKQGENCENRPKMMAEESMKTHQPLRDLKRVLKKRAKA